MWTSLWCHSQSNKSTCHTFYQYNQNNQKGWYTGKFNYHLAHIYFNDKITKGNKTAQESANNLPNLWKNSKSVPPPVDGHAFLSVEYDLTHQIQEYITIIDAVVKTSFFGNSCVKALLQGLDDWYRPIYWLKTIQCSIPCSLEPT